MPRVGPGFLCSCAWCAVCSGERQGGKDGLGGAEQPLGSDEPSWEKSGVVGSGAAGCAGAGSHLALGQGAQQSLVQSAWTWHELSWRQLSCRSDAQPGRGCSAAGTWRGSPCISAARAVTLGLFIL